MTPPRTHTTPRRGEDWPAVARRILPGEDVEAAVQKLKSWNLHLLVRRPPGEFLGSDILFTEPPRPQAGADAR